MKIKLEGFQIAWNKSIVKKWEKLKTTPRFLAQVAEHMIAPMIKMRNTEYEKKMEWISRALL